MEESVGQFGVAIAVLVFYWQLFSNLDELVVYKYDDAGRMIGASFSGGPVIEELVQLAVIGGRAGADVKYDAIIFDDRSGALSIEGLSVQAPEGAFDLAAARISGTPDDKPTVDLRVEFDGLRLDPSQMQLPPAAQIQVGMLGIQTIEADGALEIAYDLPTSNARAILSLDVAEIGRMTFAVDLADLHVDQSGFEPRPAGGLASASVAFENDGVLKLALAMMGAANVDEATAQQLAGLAADQFVAQLSGGQDVPPAAREIADEMEAAIARFLVDGDQIAVSVAPDEPIDFADLQELERVAFDVDARVEALQLLNPTVKAAPVAARAIIVDPISGGAPLLDRAEALIDGLGAPRNLDGAITLLTPEAEAGDVEARMLLVEAYEARKADGDLRAAYAQALRAEAAGADGADAAVSAIGAELSVADLLSVQAAAFTPDALGDLRSAASAGDASAMRELAQAYHTGEGAPRSLVEAYRWALLSAAAGDAAGLRLRDSLEARFAYAESDDRAVWGAALTTVSTEALTAWNTGLGAAAAEAAAR